MASVETDRVFADSKAQVELLSRVQESLARAADKSESLLEAIESSEARAGDSEVGGAPRGL